MLVRGVSPGFEPNEGRLSMESRTLDLGGLPEPIARGLEVVAEMARTMAPTPEEKPAGRLPELPEWPLGVIGPLGREEIYSDYNCRC